MTASDIGAADPALARGIVSDAFNTDDPVEGGRSYLRLAMLEARTTADPTTLIAINRLYLDWLKTANAMGGTQCREVTGRSFFDGVPDMPEIALSRERLLARIMLEKDQFNGQPINDPVPTDQIPDWAMAEVSEKLALPPEAIVASLGNQADPNRCQVTIALVEALLARPEDAHRALLVTL